MTIDPALARNALRYLAGALVARGLIGAEAGSAIASDPLLGEAVSVAAGLVLGAGTEIFYALARKLGWRT